MNESYDRAEQEVKNMNQRLEDINIQNNLAEIAARSARVVARMESILFKSKLANSNKEIPGKHFLTHWLKELKRVKNVSPKSRRVARYLSSLKIIGMGVLFGIGGTVMAGFVCMYLRIRRIAQRKRIL